METRGNSSSAGTYHSGNSLAHEPHLQASPECKGQLKEKRANRDVDGNAQGSQKGVGAFLKDDVLSHLAIIPIKTQRIFG